MNSDDVGRRSSQAFDHVPGGSLANLLAWRCKEWADFGFVYVEDEGPWSFGALARCAAELADELAAVGVRRGDRVLLRLGNDERYVGALFATWLCGASVIAMHPSAPATDTARVITSMGARVMVTQSDDGSANAIDPTVDVKVLALDRIPRAQGAADITPTLRPPEVDADAEALVLLTSGSTGAPKGVVLTHGNGWSNLRATVSAFRSDTSMTAIPSGPKPPNLIANPVSHTAGVVRLLFALYVGRSVVLLRKFDALAAKRAIDRHGIDNLAINPTMIRMLLEAIPPEADLGPVRYVSSGTAPLPPALRETFEARFDVPVLQAYGQTEAFGGVTIESVSDVLAGRRRPGSVGKALPGVELRVVADGVDVGPGDDGEIWVRSASSTTGYIGDASTSPVDEDGWLHTGDVGHLDASGYLYLTGRLKNIIICGGFNIVPEEVEAALAADPAVRDAAVVGIMDERLGEIPVAMVEADDSSDAILARVAASLAPYKRPRRLIVVEYLPRVPNGKVDLRTVIELMSNAPE